MWKSEGITIIHKIIPSPISYTSIFPTCWRYKANGLSTNSSICQKNIFSRKSIQFSSISHIKSIKHTPIAFPFLLSQQKFIGVGYTPSSYSNRSIFTLSRQQFKFQSIKYKEVVKTTSKLSSLPIVSISIIIPRRYQYQNTRQRNDRDNTALFQVIIVVLRLIARSLPYLWKNQIIQTAWHKYPKLFITLFLIPVTGFIAFMISHASFVPYSNRLHFTFLGPTSELNLGNTAYQEVVTTEKGRILPPDHPVVQQVKNIATNILKIAADDGVAPKNMQWEVNVIDSEVANAFVLPNGKIFVYTAILPVAKNQAGLALIMGHEVSHALAHHAVEKMGFMAILLIAYEFGRGIVDANSKESSWIKNLLGFAALTVAQFALPLAHSRKMEIEADKIGLTLMAKAGYDPNAGVEVWERMQTEAQSKGSKQPAFEFLSTHPSYEHRISNMKKWAADAEILYQERKQRLKGELRQLPDSLAPLRTDGMLSSREKRRLDTERNSGSLGIEASALAVGPYKDALRMANTGN